MNIYEQAKDAAYRVETPDTGTNAGITILHFRTPAEVNEWTTKIQLTGQTPLPGETAILQAD